MIRCARPASVREFWLQKHNEHQTNTRSAGIAAVDQHAGLQSLLWRLSAETLVLVHRSKLLLCRLDERPFVHQLPLPGQSLSAGHRGEAPGFERQQSGAHQKHSLAGSVMISLRETDYFLSRSERSTLPATPAVTLPIVAVLLNDREPGRR
jgi:hypothetical protein